MALSAALAPALSIEESREARIFLQQLSIKTVSNDMESSLLVTSSESLEDAEILARGHPKRRVVGIECLRHCVMHNVPIPQRNSPVLYCTLRGKFVCFSGLTREQKAHFTSLTEAMGGNVCRNLEIDVTHLIAESYDSEKCRYVVDAARRGQANVRIVETNWLTCCWTRRCLQPEETYLLPLKIFSDKRMSCTGFDIEERTAISKLARQFGAEFVADLDKRCTHLIANGTTGAKYAFARMHEIPVVTKQWLIDCCLRLECLDPEGNAGTTALTSISRSMPIFLVEDLDSDLSRSSGVLECENSRSRSQREEDKTFFEGLKFFFPDDFSPNEIKELRIMSRQGGASFELHQSNQPLSNLRGITHYITKTAELTQRDIKILDNFAYKTTCVLADWIRESSRLGVCVPTRKYLSSYPTSTVEDRLKSDSNRATGTMESRDIRTPRPPTSRSSSQRSDSGATANIETTNLQIPPMDSTATGLRPASLVIVGNSANISSLVRANMKPSLDSPSAQQDPLRPSSTFLNSEDSRDSESSTTTRSLVFKGRTFLLGANLSVRSREELTQAVEGCGGRVLNSRPNLAEPAADFEVRSLASGNEEPSMPSSEGMNGGGGRCAAFGRPKRQLSASRTLPITKVVSEYWIRKSAALGTLMDHEDSAIYRPLKMALPTATLRSINMVLTGAHGSVKQLIHWLAEQAGVRIDPENRLSRFKTTHLLVVTEGPPPEIEVETRVREVTPKELKATEWGISLVSLRWLEDCVLADTVIPAVDLQSRATRGLSSSSSERMGLCSSTVLRPQRDCSEVLPSDDESPFALAYSVVGSIEKSLPVSVDKSENSIIIDEDQPSGKAPPEKLRSTSKPTTPSPRARLSGPIQVEPVFEAIMISSQGSAGSRKGSGRACPSSRNASQSRPDRTPSCSQASDRSRSCSQRPSQKWSGRDSGQLHHIEQVGMNVGVQQRSTSTNNSSANGFRDSDQNKVVGNDEKKVPQNFDDQSNQPCSHFPPALCPSADIDAEALSPPLNSTLAVDERPTARKKAACGAAVRTEGDKDGSGEPGSSAVAAAADDWNGLKEVLAALTERPTHGALGGAVGVGRRRRAVARGSTPRSPLVSVPAAMRLATRSQEEDGDEDPLIPADDMESQAVIYVNVEERESKRRLLENARLRASRRQAAAAAAKAAATAVSEPSAVSATSRLVKCAASVADEECEVDGGGSSLRVGSKRRRSLGPFSGGGGASAAEPNSACSLRRRLSQRTARVP